MIKLLLIILIFNLIIGQSVKSNKVYLDSLLNISKFNNINTKYNTILGRDNDPKKITDISKAKLFSRKIGWSMLTSPGLRFLTKYLYPKSTKSHFNVKNAVAFTIDDGFCGIDNINGCMIDEIRELLNSYNAHATFFISGSHCINASIDQVNKLINDGHEIANHNMMDWSYKEYTLEEFEFDLLLTKQILTLYNQEYSSWYRAPMGELSTNMQKIINKHNMIHVVSAAFAHDTAIPDPIWISNCVLNKTTHGSIILIHMPEKDVREWNYKAIELTLKGLQEKNMSILNLSEINELEKESN